MFSYHQFQEGLILFLVSHLVILIYQFIKENLQCLGLGMNVKSYDDSGNSIISEKGELVCETPFPSMPIFFGMIKMMLSIMKHIFQNLKKNGHMAIIYQ